MKKTITIVSVLVLVFSLFMFAACGGNETTDYGTLTVKNVVNLTEEESQTLEATFSKTEHKSEITYSFEGNDIKIENGVVTALVGEKTVTVTATTSHHTTTFTVTTKSKAVIDYGTLTIQDKTQVYVGEQTTPVNPVFSKQEYKSDITYTFTGDAIKIENDEITAFTGGVTVVVTATTSHHSTTFSVSTIEYAEDKGTLTIADIDDLVEGDSKDLTIEFSVSKFESEITYSFEGNAIEINDGVVTALIGGERVAVFANTDYHSTVFYVTTIEKDYGTLTISDVVELETTDSETLEVTFSMPEYARDITYSFEGDAIEINDGVVTALVAGETVVVTATTEHHTTTFTVTTIAKDYGTLTIANIAGLTVDGAAVKIRPQFSIEEYKSDITYTFIGDAIKIENGYATALIGGETVTVTATTEYHTATFTITTRYDYGTLKINDILAWVDYPASDFYPIFSKEQFAGPIAYTYDSTKITINEAKGLVTALVSGDHKVTAKSAHHETTFTVKCSVVDKTGEEWNTSKYDAYKNEMNTKWTTDKSDSKTTMFIGDSFFDARSFWSGFYNTYEEYDAQCFGISATTSYDWEMYMDSFIVPKAPKNIVMHIGTNNFYDDHKTADETLNTLQRLFTTMHGKLPNTKIYYFGITQRSNTTYAAEVSTVNTKMTAWCGERSWITYIDTPSRITTSMLKDGVHVKPEHYNVFVDNLALTDIDITARVFDPTINDITKTVTDVVASSQTIIYKNEVLTRNFVISGKIDITSSLSNAHVEFKFAGDNLRMLLWARDNLGQFKASFSCNGYDSNAPADAIYTHTEGTTLTLSWKLVVTGDDAYLYINNELKLVFVSIPSGTNAIGVKFGAEKTACKFYDMQAKTLRRDKDEYNAELASMQSVITEYDNKTTTQTAYRPS